MTAGAAAALSGRADADTCDAGRGEENQEFNLKFPAEFYWRSKACNRIGKSCDKPCPPQAY